MNKFVATAIALCIGAVSVAAHAQAGGKKEVDPYTQGAKVNDKVDPYTQGAKADDKFDPYTQGANKSTRADLAPAEPAKKGAKKKAAPAKTTN